MKLTTRREPKPRLRASSVLENQKPENTRAQIEAFLNSRSMEELRELARKPTPLEWSEQQLLINARWLGSLDPEFFDTVKKRPEIRLAMQAKMAEEEKTLSTMGPTVNHQGLTPAGVEANLRKIAAVHFQLFPEDRSNSYFTPDRLARQLALEKNTPFASKISAAYQLCVVWPTQKDRILSELFQPQELGQAFILGNFAYKAPQRPNTSPPSTTVRRKPHNLLVNFLVLFPQQKPALTEQIKVQRAKVENLPEGNLFAIVLKQQELTMLDAELVELDQDGRLRFVFKAPAVGGQPALPPRSLI